MSIYYWNKSGGHTCHICFNHCLHCIAVKQCMFDMLSRHDVTLHHLKGWTMVGIFVICSKWPKTYKNTGKVLFIYCIFFTIVAMEAYLERISHQLTAVPPITFFFKPFSAQNHICYSYILYVPPSDANYNSVKDQNPDLA